MFSSSASIMVPLLFVIELKELNVVVVGSRGVGGGFCSIDLLNNVIKLGEFLALLIGLAETDTNLLGGVHAKGIHDISQEEQVELALAIPVVDVTDLFNSLGINHLDYVFVLALHWVTAVGELILPGRTGR